MDNDLSGRMKKDWNERAENDPLYWTVSAPLDGPGSWDVDAYFQSGERCLRTSLDFFLTDEDTAGAALEIGCGAGRVSQALALRFPWVHALDVSPVMLGKAKQFAQERGVQNIEWHEGDGLGAQVPGLHGQISTVYSTLVLSHIPDPLVQVQYIKDIGWLLEPEGKFLITLYDDHAGYERTKRTWNMARETGVPDGWHDWTADVLPSYETFIRTPIPHDAVNAAMEAGGLRWATIGGEGTDMWMIAGRKTPPTIILETSQAEMAIEQAH